ncbi:hypothetical protein DFH29DRAFT_993934 [Suillus ampliporus]|nr:hypothetical protein DFH29DRAFT_993934 [Suillus ampliporus]
MTLSIKVGTEVGDASSEDVILVRGASAEVDRVVKEILQVVKDAKIDAIASSYLITIPAAMQKVSNPVPRIRHPDWLHRRVAGAVDKFKQNKVTNFFTRATADMQSLAQSHTQTIDAELDMEDFGQDKALGRPCIAIVNRKSHNQTPEPDEEVSDDEAPLPDPTISYSAWIRAIKPRWKKQRNARLGNAGDAIVPSMFKGTRVRATQRWDIMQIRPSKIPGRFTLWASVDAQLVPVPLRIPREFFLHLKTPPRDSLFQPEYYAFEKVVRHFPCDLPCSNLYRISVKEDVYQEIQEHFMDLINDPNVDGMFERQVPLEMRALLKLGKTCTVDELGMTLNCAQSSGVDLSQLDRASTSLSRRIYLDGGRSGKYIFLYHACSSTSHVHVFAIELGLLENMLYTVVISSIKDQIYFFDTWVPKLSKFPVLSMSKAKAVHTLNAFPWQPDVAQKMVQRYLSLGTWLDRSIALADYYNVPIGHIDGD